MMSDNLQGRMSTDPNEKMRLCADGTFLKKMEDGTVVEITEEYYKRMIEELELTISTGIGYSITDPVPNTIQFNRDNKEVGKITFVEGKMHFEGNADESALIMFETYTLKNNAHIDKLEAQLKRQGEEIYTLRQYGNKDCTAMADEALAANRLDQIEIRSTDSAGVGVTRPISILKAEEKES